MPGQLPCAPLASGVGAERANCFLGIARVFERRTCSSSGALLFHSSRMQTSQVDVDFGPLVAVEDRCVQHALTNDQRLCGLDVLVVDYVT